MTDAANIAMNITLFMIILAAPVGMMFAHIKSRIRWAKLHNRIDNWTDELTYGMPKKLYDYKHTEDLRTVYHKDSQLNKQIWGDPKYKSESAFGSRRRIIGINDPGDSIGEMHKWA